MRGSTPLDVAAASVMDNYDLALALTELDLEKVGTTAVSFRTLFTSLLNSCSLLIGSIYRLLSSGRWCSIWQAAVCRVLRRCSLKDTQTSAGILSRASDTWTYCALLSSVTVRER